MNAFAFQRNAEALATASVEISHDRKTENIARALIGKQNVIVFGQQGFGKSHLTDAVGTQLLSQGISALNIRGLESLRHSPFGVLTSSTNLALAETMGGPRGPTAAGLLAVATRLNPGRGSIASNCYVIIVDDAHLLDASTMRLLHQLAIERSLALLLTSEPLSSLRAAKVGPETADLLNDLWIKGRTHRIDLAPLSAAEAAHLLREFAPRESFDLVTRALLYVNSGGSRVLFRELAIEALSHKPHPDDRNRVTQSSITPSARVLDLVCHELRTLSSAQITLLALMSTLNGLSPLRAKLILGAAELQDLIHRGYVNTVTRRSNLLRPQKLVGAAALAQTDPSDLHAATAKLIRVLLSESGHRLSESPGKCLAIAASWTESGELPENIVAEWGSAVVTEVLLTASQKSRLTGFPDDAGRYSLLATEIQPDIDSLLEHSRALAGARLFPEALLLLVQVPALFRSPADAIALLRWALALATVSTSPQHIFERLTEHAESWFPADAQMAGERAFLRLSLSLREMNWEETATSGEIIARTESNHIVTRIRAACMSAVARAYQGRTVQALRLLEIAVSLNASEPTAPYTKGLSPDSLTLEIFFSTAEVRLLSGSDIEVISDELDEWVERSVTDEEWGNLGHLCYIAAQLAYYRGDIVQAETELSSAEAHFHRADPDGWQPWAQALHASNLAQMGLLDTARHKLRQARSGCAQTNVSHRLRFETDRAAANLLWFSGDADGALLLYQQLSEGPAGNAPALSSWILERQAYLGDTQDLILTELDLAVANSDSPLLQVSAHRLRAIVNDDAAGLDAAAEQLAVMGAYGRAAFVGEEAALVHLRRGDRVAAAASRQQVESWSSETQSTENISLVPALGVGEPDAETTLTRRETQVWTHAGQGQSNQEIAAELFLSVRTIESHLYQARLKLGKAPRS